MLAASWNSHNHVDERASKVLSLLVWRFGLRSGSRWSGSVVIYLVQQFAFFSILLYVFSLKFKNKLPVRKVSQNESVFRARRCSSSKKNITFFMVSSQRILMHVVLLAKVIAHLLKSS